MAVSSRLAPWMLLVLALPHQARAGDVVPMDFCTEVAGTLNIHWQRVDSNFCTAIEFTDGDLADAADGSFSMQGTSSSDISCAGTAIYTFTLSEDRTTLTGMDTLSNVPMTLVRARGERCFVGDWIAEPYHYVGTMSGAAAGEVFISGFEG